MFFFSYEKQTIFGMTRYSISNCGMVNGVESSVSASTSPLSMGLLIMMSLCNFTISPVATPISYVVNHVVVRSVLFFDGFVVTRMCGANLGWLPERKPWGDF